MAYLENSVEVAKNSSTKQLHQAPLMLDETHTHTQYGENRFLPNLFSFQTSFLWRGLGGLCHLENK